MVAEVPESNWRWAVLFAAFCMNFIVLGLRRAHGVLYVGFLSTFGITREEAAWPIMLSSSISFFVGPFSGFLTHYFSIREIVFSGCAIASAGIFLCYFAKKLDYITLLFGVVQGFGTGLLIPLNSVIINQYFHKIRATAVGIGFAGSAIGSMLLPVSILYIQDEYGLRGCFLLLSGITMEGLVAASLYRPAPLMAVTSSPTVQNCEEVMTLSNSVKVKIAEKEFQSSKFQHNEFVHKLINAIEVLKHSSFPIICLNYVAFFCSLHSYLVTFVDFAMDRGVSESKATFCITVFSVGDLIGRLFTGWITDFGYIRRKNLICLYLLGIAVCFMTIPLVSSYVAIMSWSVAYGILFGSAYPLFSVIMTEYLGIQRLPMAVGFSAFAVGCVILASPILTGVFRDVIQSYDLLFLTLGTFTAIGPILWLLSPLFRRCARRLASWRGISR